MNAHAPELSADLAFALELADLADSIALPRFRAADLSVSTKPDRTHVTDADLAVERALRAEIARSRPADAFFGEESGSGSGGSRCWVLDPIDGTANFLRGVANWATLISLEVDGVPTVGVVSAPAMGSRWFAENGGGAWAVEHGSDPRRMHASRVGQLADASLSFQSIAQWRDAGFQPALLELAERVWRDRAYGDSWSYMLLADGLIDIVAEFDVKSYDISAHVPIVREAGGRFSDIAGNESAWNGSALATNGHLHDSVLELLAAHLPRPVA